MKLAISIVSWNGRELLAKCLASLQQHCDPDSVRVIVIDNASSDGTPQMVREEFPEVTLVESGGNLGFGKAHNLVAQHSDEPFVLFLNPDAEFVEPAHEQMLEVFEEHPDVALVGCRTTEGDGTVQALGCQLPTSPWSELLTNLMVSRATMPLVRRLLPYQDPDSSGFVRKLYGGCLMARREALDQVGWFDERFFMYGEDVDLSRRMEAAGQRLFYLADATVMHIGGGCSEKAPGRFATVMQCESIAKLMNKYYGWLGRTAFRLIIFTRACFRIALTALAGCCAWFFRRANGKKLKQSFGKNMAMLRWSLGREQATIPR